MESARRLAITKQHLAGRPPKATSESILALVRDLCYVQWDPISIVAPSHLLTFWNRLDEFHPADLDRLLWKEKKLFETWAHQLSIVLTEDYPLYYSLMRRYPESLSDSWGGWRERARKFLPAHAELRKKILNDLGEKGPLQLSQFRDYVRTKRSADGWSSGSDVSNMLFHMQMMGDVMIVGHEGNLNVWGLSEKFLPKWTKKKDLGEEGWEREAAQRAIRALGLASPREMHLYFVQGHYHNLKKTLQQLEQESIVHRVRITGLEGRTERYIHDKDIQLLESMNTEDDWEPRISLLPPFDNFVNGSRGWTGKLFGLFYVHEMFLPESKRKYGTYSMPVLWGDRVIGRVDPRIDKTSQKLLINSVHIEPGVSRDREVGSSIGEKIMELAEFVGAKEVEYGAGVPKTWKTPLR